MTQLFNNFSSTVFDIILEKQEVGKARYKCVAGDWIGGNINDIYKPLEPVSMKIILKNMFEALGEKREVYSPKFELVKERAIVNYNELLILYTSNPIII